MFLAEHYCPESSARLVQEPAARDHKFPSLAERDKKLILANAVGRWQERILQSLTLIRTVLRVSSVPRSKRKATIYTEAKALGPDNEAEECRK